MNVTSLITADYENIAINIEDPAFRGRNQSSIGYEKVLFAGTDAVRCANQAIFSILEQFHGYKLVFFQLFACFFEIDHEVSFASAAGLAYYWSSV